MTVCWMCTHKFLFSFKSSNSILLRFLLKYCLLCLVLNLSYLLLADNLGNSYLTSFFYTGAVNRNKLTQSFKAYQNAVSLKSKTLCKESLSCLILVFLEIFVFLLLFWMKTLNVWWCASVERQKIGFQFRSILQVGHSKFTFFAPSFLYGFFKSWRALPHYPSSGWLCNSFPFAWSFANYSITNI